MGRLDTDRETAVHEAGHAVAAIALDLRFERVFLGGDAYAGGFFTGRFQRNVEKLNDDHEVEKEIIISLAGPAAVAVLCGTTPTGDENDLERAYRDAVHLGGPDEQEGIVLRCNQSARAILVASADSVRVIAESLEDRRSLQYSEVVDLVGDKIVTASARIDFFSAPGS